MADDANAVNTTEVADTSTTDSAPVENQTFDAEESLESVDISAELLGNDDDDSDAKSDDSDSTEETDSKADNDQDTTDTENTDQAEETKTEEPQYTKAEQRKEQLNAEIREMVELKKQYEQELAQYQQQQQSSDQPFTEEQLLNEVNPDTGEYFTPAEARTVLLEQQVQQMQQSLQQREYQAQVERSQTDLARDIESSLKEYPVFDSRSDQYNAGIADKARNFIQANLVTDANGQIVGSRMPVREILSTFVEIQSSGTAQGEAKARQATNRMMANADITGGASNATSGDKDPYLQGFEAEL